MMIFASKNKAKWGARGRIWVYIVALESLSEDEFSLYRLSMTFSGRFLFFFFWRKLRTTKFGIYQLFIQVINTKRALTTPKKHPPPLWRNPLTFIP